MNGPIIRAIPKPGGPDPIPLGPIRFSGPKGWRGPGFGGGPRNGMGGTLDYAWPTGK